MKHWCNLKKTKYHYHGAWSDPEIEYGGKMLNEWDVQEYVGDTFNGIMEDSGIEIPPHEWHEKFAKWVNENQEEVYSLLDDLWAMV